MKMFIIVKKVVFVSFEVFTVLYHIFTIYNKEHGAKFSGITIVYQILLKFYYFI